MGWQDRDYTRKRPPESGGGHDPSADEHDDTNGDDGPDDLEAPDASDLDDGTEPAFVRCPNCRKMIPDDAERCSHCGHYVEDAELTAERPTWVWVGIGLALATAVLWAILR
jgi:hypothetical protein